MRIRLRLGGILFLSLISGTLSCGGNGSSLSLSESSSSGSGSGTLSTIAGFGTAPANGVSTIPITITLKDSGGSPIVGETPIFSASGSGVVVGACSVSDSGGVSNCTLASTVAETKQLVLLSPNLILGESVTFTVVVGATRVSIEDAPDGLGTEINTLNLANAQNVTLYAVSRDAGSNFVQNESVNWSVSDPDVGIFSQATGSSTVFTPHHLAGTVTIQADHATLIDDTTGNINVTYSVTDIGGVSLWLKGDSFTGLSDSDPVDTWKDSSGAGHHASQSTASYRPLYRQGVQNGKSSVDFDGVDDYLDDAHGYNARTVFVVYRVTAAQPTTDLGQFWGNYNEGVQVALDRRPGSGWSFDGNGSNQGKFGINGAAYGGFSANPTSPLYTLNTFQVIAVEFDATRAVTRQVIGSLVPQFTPGQHQYGGDIAELIVFNQTLTAPQRTDVESYLNTKYNLGF